MLHVSYVLPSTCTPESSHRLGSLWARTVAYARGRLVRAKVLITPVVSLSNINVEADDRSIFEKIKDFPASEISRLVAAGVDYGPELQGVPYLQVWQILETDVFPFGGRISPLLVLDKAAQMYPT